MFISASLPSSKSSLLEKWTGKSLRYLADEGALKLPPHLEHCIYGPKLKESEMFNLLRKIVSKAIDAQKQTLVFVEAREDAVNLASELKGAESFTSLDSASERVELLTRFHSG